MIDVNLFKGMHVYEYTPLSVLVFASNVIHTNDILLVIISAMPFYSNSIISKIYIIHGVSISF